MRILLLFMILLLPDYGTAECVREYFAQPVVYDRATSIDFYYTSINIDTINACVEFCAGRQFCRTAIYNTLTKTCAISYEFTQNCRYSHARHTDYQLPPDSDSNLVQLACITKCEEDDKRQQQHRDRAPIKLITGIPEGPLKVAEKEKDANKESIPTPAPLPSRVRIVTGIPHDGFDIPTIYPPTLNSHNNLNQIARDDPQQNRVLISKSSESEPDASKHVNRVTLDNISSFGQGIPYIETLPLKDTSNEIAKSGRNSKVCYRTVRRHYLLGAEFEKHDGKSINECRCLCAATHDADSLHKCQSFHYYAIGGRCILNKDSHFGKYDLIEDIDSIYQYVSCDSDLLQSVAHNMCENYGKMDIIATTTEKSAEDKPERTTMTSNVEVETSTAWPTSSTTTQAIPIESTTQHTAQSSIVTTESSTAHPSTSTKATTVTATTERSITTSTNANEESFITEPPEEEEEEEDEDEDVDEDEILESSGDKNSDDELDDNEITSSKEQGRVTGGVTRVDGVRNHRGNKISWRRLQRIERQKQKRRRQRAQKQKEKEKRRRMKQLARARAKKRLEMQRRTEKLRQEAKRLKAQRKKIEREKAIQEREMQKSSKELMITSAFVTTVEPKITKVTTEATTETTSQSSFITSPLITHKDLKSDLSGTAREEPETTTHESSEITSETPKWTTSRATLNTKAAIQRQEEFEEEENEGLNVEKHGCFERIHGYMMVSVAGGLEHDVSVEECECHCASSRHSGRYPFQCTSTTYYHNERDCILNLEDRVMRPSLFEPQIANFNATYIGMICDHATALTKLHSNLDIETCKMTESSTTPATTTQQSVQAQTKKKKNDKIDSCFLELSDFVLEGVALAVESNVTPQDCKCRCLESEQKYGEPCQSFQYYYESETCLINRHNRFNNPEKFNYVPGPPARGYFENTCIGKDNMRESYLRNICKIDDDEIVSGNLLSKEGEHKELKREIEQSLNISTTTVTPTTTAKQSKPMDEEVKMHKMHGADNFEPAEEDEKDYSHEFEESSGSDEYEDDGDDLLTSNEEYDEDDETTDEDEQENSEELKRPLSKKRRHRAEKFIDSDDALAETDDQEVKMRKRKLRAFRRGRFGEGRKRKHRFGLKKRPENEDNKLVISQPKSEYLNVVVTERPRHIPRHTTTEHRPISSRKKSAKGIPEAEGVDSFEATLEKELETTLATELEDAATRGADSAMTTQSISTIPTTTTTEASETTTTERTRRSRRPKGKRTDGGELNRVHGVKTRKFDEKFLKSLPEKLEITTTRRPYVTSTTASYPPAGRCTYSALYQTTFLGRKLLKSVQVKEASDCFAACYALRCRSANLIASGKLNTCDLYRDSLIDYRRPDMIEFGADTVYFDGINCDGVQT